MCVCVCVLLGPSIVSVINNTLFIIINTSLPSHHVHSNVSNTTHVLDNLGFLAGYLTDW